MAIKRAKLIMEVFGPSSAPETARRELDRSDEAVIALARLIGHQIAREQFERYEAQARKANRRKRNTPT
ncbi:hypothetical protein [Martelella soudanensis]|uniref:hypothetical protein n=1 Tax=unclassified Martelella TaxID=2629616 RepID=UPI0015E036B1|nr:MULTISPECIES: hypothetical protein [unclassified Martelella]